MSRKIDPLVRAVKKAYAASASCPLEKLLLEEGRWKRKATIARNKLADVRSEINRLAWELAQEKDGLKPVKINGPSKGVAV